jgi:allophanate hydrolase subunit 2
LRRARAGDLVTEGVCVGAIQVPESGEPIVLFVDQHTTGGYPKIANVISADLAALGQLRPRDRIRFEQVSFAHARAALAARERAIEAAWEGS